MKIEEKIVKLLKDKNFKISFAESCTGGLLVSTIVNVSGASNVLEESYVTYSEKSKQKILGVNKSTIDKFSVYSKEVSIEMVKGLFEKTKSNVCCSVTGRAGGCQDPLNGTFDYSIIIFSNNEYKIYSFNDKVTGSRNEVREKQTNIILEKIYEILLNY